MSKHKKIYQKHFNYSDSEYIPCSVCRSSAVDIHHIKYKSQGGKDEINNLIALCRSCHDKAHFKKKPYIHPIELEQIQQKLLNTFKG